MMAKQYRDFRKQAGIDGPTGAPLQFATIFGESGYRLPNDIGLRSEATGDDSPAAARGTTLVVTWLDIARQDGATAGTVAPPAVGCLLDFLSLGIDNSWEALVKRSGQDARSPEQEADRNDAASREESTAQEVLQFVTKRGPLAIWPHQDSLSREDETYRLSEPVYYYWGLARRMRTLLLLSQHLYGYPVERPTAADLAELLGRVPARGEPGLKNEMAEIITGWMRCARTHPAIETRPEGTGWQHVLRLPNWQMATEWNFDQEAERRIGRELLQPGVRYKALRLLPREDQCASPVFAILVMQMAAALAAPEGILQCRFCQSLFEPTRKPRYDRHLPTCGGVNCRRCARNDFQNRWNRQKREKICPGSEAGNVNAD